MIKRSIFVGLLVLILIGIAAPFVHGDRYGQQIREGLERGLHRKVEIGAVHFNLFTGPGFTVQDVVIYDDPAFGIEPFAHMTELQARVRLTSLFTGKLDFSTLRFIAPSVNLVKPHTGTWNVVKLLQDAKRAQSVPEIQVSDGHIFLKLDDTKSAFYIAAADVTITPRRDSLAIRFAGEPARTDRSARSAGLMTARGTLTGGNLDLDLELEESPVDELGGLLRGRRLEYHGHVSSKAKLSGPLSNLSISGSFNLADVHRWDRTMDHDSSWAVRFKGKVDLANERIEIATINSPNQLQLEVSNLLE
ncbi:MAG TPA: AsmA family protein, partial [Bryobacteraceae bacterium]|nr:AsmA family protein [Bryobacteraceae bacterium]